MRQSRCPAGIFYDCIFLDYSQPIFGGKSMACERHSVESVTLVRQLFQDQLVALVQNGFPLTDSLAGMHLASLDAASVVMGQTGAVEFARDMADEHERKILNGMPPVSLRGIAQ
jgi:hypothetical protein